MVEEERLEGMDASGDEVTPDQTGQEGAAEGESGAGEDPPTTSSTLEKQPYTEEELESLLAEDKDIDSSRLSLEGKLIQKSFERGYTRKFQDLGEQRRQMTARKEETSQDPREELYQRYLENPTQVNREIDGEVNKLLNADPLDEGYKEAQQKIFQYQSMQREFHERRVSEASVSNEIQRAADTVRGRVLTEVPEFLSKRGNIAEYITDEYGLSLEEQDYLTNPVYVGVETAVKNTLLANRLYDVANAGKAADIKAKKAPDQLARAAGGGVKTGSKQSDPNKMTMAEYSAYRSKRDQRII